MVRDVQIHAALLVADYPRTSAYVATMLCLRLVLRGAFGW